MPCMDVRAGRFAEPPGGSPLSPLPMLLRLTCGFWPIRAAVNVASSTNACALEHPSEAAVPLLCNRAVSVQAGCGAGQSKGNRACVRCGVLCCAVPAVRSVRSGRSLQHAYTYAAGPLLNIKRATSNHGTLFCLLGRGGALGESRGQQCAMLCGCCSYEGAGWQEKSRGGRNAKRPAA